MRFEKQFREAFPETIGETDKEFDLSNYTEWLESLAEEKILQSTSPTNSDYEAALRVAVAFDKYCDNGALFSSFVEWVEQRLNAEKDRHCS